MPPGPADDSPEPPALSEDEAAFRASFALVVDWYRVSQLPTLVYAFVPAMLLFVPAGGALISFGRIDACPPTLAPWVTLAGVLVMAAGPIWCGVTLVRSIRGDAYVAIRMDGLALRLDGAAEERVIPWRDIEDIRYDRAAKRAVITLGDHESCVIRAQFADISLEELTRRMRDARRLAVWERLAPRPGSQ